MTIRNSTEAKVRIVARAADDLKAEDVLVLDVRGICTFTDFFLIASAGSRNQFRAILREIRSRLSEGGFTPPRAEDEDSGRWVVLDLGDVVVHLFDPHARAHYNLEALWGDAHSVDTASFLTA